MKNKKERSAMSGFIIGLSGRRGTGKSLISNHLITHHGFRRLHPFQGGKEACMGYFRHIGAEKDQAERMVNGDLKDLPSNLLPDNQTPRFFMEKLGHFMGVKLGPDWTIGREIKRTMEDDPNARIIAESIVYEADVLRAQGGFIVGVTRPQAGIAGVETDAATAMITPDIEFLNDGDTIPDLERRVDILLSEIQDMAAMSEPDLF